MRLCVGVWVGVCVFCVLRDGGIYIHTYTDLNTHRSQIRGRRGGGWTKGKEADTTRVSPTLGLFGGVCGGGRAKVTLIGDIAGGVEDAFLVALLVMNDVEEGRGVMVLICVCGYVCVCM